LLNLIKIAVKLNTFARFGFVDAKFATQANSRQVLVIDSVKVDRVSLGVAGAALFDFNRYPERDGERNNDNQKRKRNLQEERLPVPCEKVPQKKPLWVVHCVTS
jgi:hypothetical protein